MNIEDDLAAHPAALRKEIRRLRALLPTDLSEHATAEDMKLGALRNAGLGYFCGIIRIGGGCACPGSCYHAAEDVLKALEVSGYTITKLIRHAPAA